MIALIAIAAFATSLAVGFVAPFRHQVGPGYALVLVAYFAWITLTVAGCTLHVEVEMRSIPSLRGEPARQGQVSTANPQSPASERLPPWKSPQVGVSVGGGDTQSCSVLTISSGSTVTCSASEWAVFDGATCTTKCEPMPEFMINLRAGWPSNVAVEL